MIMDLCQNASAEPFEPPAAQVPDPESLMLVSAESHALADAMPAAVPTKEQIFRLQQAMIPIQCEMPDAEHFFAPGMYARRLAVPAGTLLVGKAHKHTCFMMVLKGRALIISEFGREEVSAGQVFVSPPGIKRIGLMFEDCVFVNVHLNAGDSTDLEEIEAENIISESCYFDEAQFKELLS